MSVSLRRPMALVFAFVLLAGGLCQLATVRADPPCGDGTRAVPVDKCNVTYAVPGRFWVGAGIGCGGGNKDTNNPTDCGKAFMATQKSPVIACDGFGTPVVRCGDCYTIECTETQSIIIPTYGLCAVMTNCVWVGTEAGGSCTTEDEVDNYRVQLKYDVCAIPTCAG